MDRAETKENLKMKQILFILLFSIVPLSWAEEGSDEAVFPWEVYPKLLEPNARIAQSTIMRELCEDDGDSTFCKPDIPNDCYPSGRGWFPIFTNEEGKIIDIGSEPGGAYTQCISKEEFNICTAQPEGWDLSLVEKEKICFGY